MSSQYLCRQNARTRLRVGCTYMKSRISKTRPGASTNSERRLPPIPSIKISRLHCQHERQIADSSTSSLKDVSRQKLLASEACFSRSCQFASHLAIKFRHQSGDQVECFHGVRDAGFVEEQQICQCVQISSSSLSKAATSLSEALESQILCPW